VHYLLYLGNPTDERILSPLSKDAVSISICKLTQAITEVIKPFPYILVTIVVMHATISTASVALKFSGVSGTCAKDLRGVDKKVP
jgi:hypothetical protein